MPADNYPDVVLDAELEAEILHWLYTEIEQAKLGRQAVEQKWKEINKWYDMQELEAKKNYPFEGAAHLMIGVMPTFCETIKAKIMNTIWGPSDPFTIRHYDPRFADFVSPMRRFMTWAEDNELHLRERMGPVMLEMLKLGTAVTKTLPALEYETEFSYVSDDEDPAKGTFTEIPYISKNYPEVHHVQNADFFFQLHVRCLKDSAFKAHRMRLSWAELQARQDRGEYKGIDRIKGWTEHTRTDFEEESANVDHDPQPIDMVEYEIYEVWFKHPIRRGGTPVKMQWFVHLDSKTALRKRYNWYPMQLDPFDLCVYEEREHKIYGRGVGEISLPFQKEISTMHNQRLDSVTVRNAPLFKMKADSLLPNFITFRPGSAVRVNEMDEIESLFTGQQYDSTITDEQHSLGMLRERLGLEDFSQDMNIGQATSVLAVMAERNRRFDHTIRRVRTFFTSVMTKCMLLYQKYYPDGRAVMVLGEDGQYVEMIMNFPDQALASGIGIDVTATTASSSKELDRQNKLALFNLVTQYYGQLTQYAIQANNPQLPPDMRMAMLYIVNALTKFIEDILEDFNLTHAREIAGVIENARQAVLAGGAAAPVQPALGPGAAGMGGVSGASPQNQGTPGGAPVQ